MRTNRHRCTCGPRRKCWRNLNIWAAKKRKRWSSPTPTRSPICANRCRRCARINVRRSSRIRIKTLREICYNKAHEIYGEDLPEVGDRASGERVELHHFQWVRRYVYHRPEAGVEVQRGRLSGRIPRFCRIFLRSDHGRNHRGKSAAPALLLSGMPLQRF